MKKKTTKVTWVPEMLVLYLIILLCFLILKEYFNSDITFSEREKYFLNHRNVLTALH